MVFAILYVPLAFLLYAFNLFALVQFFLSGDFRWLLSAASLLPFSFYTLKQSFYPTVDTDSRFIFILTTLGISLFWQLQIALTDTAPWPRAFWFVIIHFFIFLSVFYLLILAPKLKTRQLAVSELGKLTNFNVMDGSKKSVSIYEFLGERNILVFYRGNWCPNSIAQLNSYKELSESFQTGGFKVFFISLQPEEAMDLLRQRFDMAHLFFLQISEQTAQKLQILHLNGVPWGALGYGRNTILPVTMGAGKNGEILFYNQETNFRTLTTAAQSLQSYQFNNQQTVSRIFHSNDELWQQLLPEELLTDYLKYRKATVQENPESFFLFFQLRNSKKKLLSEPTPEILDQVNQMISQFDLICQNNHLEKINSCGGESVAVAGLPSRLATNAVDAMMAAVQMAKFMKQNFSDFDFILLLHCGPAWGRIIGEHRPQYQIFGESCAVAARTLPALNACGVFISGAVFSQIQFLFQCHSFVGVNSPVPLGEMHQVESLKEKFLDRESGLPNLKFYEIYARLQNGAKLVAKPR